MTKKQIEDILKGFEKYPEATEVVISARGNGSGIGPTDIATFQDRGDLFRMIAPKIYGEVDITDMSLW